MVDEEGPVAVDSSDAGSTKGDAEDGEAPVTTFTNMSADELSAEELNEYKEIFNLVDRDGGGSISNSELGELMDTLGINASQEEIDLMINEIDQDSNGEIDFDEFVAVMSRKVSATYTAGQVHLAFQLFEDKSKPGHILPARLEAVLMEYCGAIVVKEEVAELVRQLETESGYFNFAEYIQLCTNDGTTPA